MGHRSVFRAALGGTEDRMNMLKILQERVPSEVRLTEKAEKKLKEIAEFLKKMGIEPLK